MHWERTLIPLVLFTATSASAKESPPEPMPDDVAPPALLELRASLGEAGRESALESKMFYRPLCDADGYPLVGNMVPKSPDGSMPGFVAPLLPPYQPSEFCGEIREDESQDGAGS